MKMTLQMRRLVIVPVAVVLSPSWLAMLFSILASEWLCCTNQGLRPSGRMTA